MALFTEDFAALFTFGRLENLQSQVDLLDMTIQCALLGQEFAAVGTHHAFDTGMGTFEMLDHVFLFLVANGTFSIHLIRIVVLGTWHNFAFFTYISIDLNKDKLTN